MAIDNNFYKNKKLKDFYFSLWFLLFTLILTISLIIYNSGINNQNEEIKLQIEKIEEDIKVVESWEDYNSIVAYNLYKKNKWVFDLIARKSQIPTFIKHLRRTYINYNMKINGFSYSNWDLSTKINIDTDTAEKTYNYWVERFSDMKLAYMKTINLLNLYNTTDSNLFVLDKVTQFSWYKNMSFNLVFKLK